MMKRTILIIVALLLAVGAYYQFSYVPAQRAAEEAAAAATKAAEEAAAAAKAAEDKAAEEAAAAAKAAEEATAKAAEEAAAAAAAATEAATEAAGAVTDAATEAAGAVTDAASMVWDATKLTSEDIMARISGAPIPQETKDTLTATYNSVKDNPSAVQMVLDQLKQAMGL
jgi:colicin import membrane protein